MEGEGLACGFVHVVVRGDGAHVQRDALAVFVFKGGVARDAAVPGHALLHHAHHHPPPAAPGARLPASHVACEQRGRRGSGIGGSRPHEDSVRIHDVRRQKRSVCSARSNTRTHLASDVV